MRISEIIKKLNLTVLSSGDFLDREINGGYVSDMLSDVLANSKKGNIWITLQTHLNVISVASIKELSGIIIVNGRKPDEDSLKKAEEEKIIVLSTDERAFQIVCKLYELGIGKNDEDI
ncbi:MAG: serine kinase [Bacteroidetes bacterium]|nr:serine kinase [Bacteroidota bacterium]MBU1678189.1 serine kinase [Bacteroidota bacterium]MBU2506902.1 serine kinase [Bacteroidota bacterium]